MARASACALLSFSGSAAAMGDVFFLQPFAVDVDGSEIECTLADGRFDVRSGGGADAVVHCSGAVRVGNAIPWQRSEHVCILYLYCYLLSTKVYLINTYRYQHIQEDSLDLGGYPDIF